MTDLDFKTQVERIRDASDIVEVIGAYVKLNRRGSGYEGLCPFHKEKTPSFKVNPSRQSFYCFGCHTGGDVFSFVQQIEGVDFLHAARVLAQRAGLPVELKPGASSRDLEERDRLFSTSLAVANFYAATLAGSPQAAAARSYLQARDLEAAREPFRIGFSPAQSDALLRWAKQTGTDLALLEKIGVAARGESGDWYDRFRGRLMFPILDDLGQVLGFSGRLMPGDPREGRTGKYVNSPETPLFRKSRILYGMHLAKKPILEKRAALLCEGQIDVIRCHLAGFDHAVAAQGTAITEDHARILHRHADDITLVLDGDTAGEEAGLRAIPLLAEAGLLSHVAVLPPGEDPDSLLRTRPREDFENLLGAAAPGMVFLCRVQLDRLADMPRETAVNRAARAAVEVAARAGSAVLQEQMLAQAAEALDLSPDALRRDVLRNRSRDRRPAPPPTPDSAPPRIPPEEVQLLELVLHFPHCLDETAPVLQPEHFQHPPCGALYRVCLGHPGDDEWDLSRACVDQPEEVKILAARLTGEDRHRFDVEEVEPHVIAHDLILAIRLRDMEARLARLRERRGQAEGAQREQLTEDSLLMKADIETVKKGWEHARPILEVHDEL